MGQLKGELIVRGMNWQEERNFLLFQSLRTRFYKMLKCLTLEDRKNACLWIICKINIPDAGFSLPEPDKEHHFPKFRYDKLGTKQMKRVVLMCLPKRSARFYGGYRIFPWPPETRTPLVYRASSIHFEFPHAFDMLTVK